MALGKLARGIARDDGKQCIKLPDLAHVGASLHAGELLDFVHYAVSHSLILTSLRRWGWDCIQQPASLSFGLRVEGVASGTSSVDQPRRRSSVPCRGSTDWIETEQF